MRFLDHVDLTGGHVKFTFKGRDLDASGNSSEADLHDDALLASRIAIRKGLGDAPEDVEYPDQELLVDPPDEFYWTYVSSSYLDGFINYTRHVRTIGVLRYMGKSYQGVEEISQEKAAENLRKALAQPHFKASTYEDDVILIRETDRHLWLFHYDMDCSDCGIIRIRKVRGIDKLIEMYKGFLGEYEHWREDAEPRGWISS